MLTDGKPQSGNCVLWTSLQKSHSVYANNENHHHYTTLLTVHALYLYSTTHEMKDGKDFLAVLYNRPNNHNTNTNEETDNVAGDGQTIALYWLLGFVLHAYRKAHLHDLQLLLNDGALPHSVGLEYNVVHTLMDLGGGLERWKTLFLEWNRDKEEIRNLFYENLIALLQDSPANGFCVSSLSVVYDMVQTTLLTDPNKKMNRREVTNLLQLFYANGHHTLLSGHPSPNVVLDALCAQYGGSFRSTALDPFLSNLYRHCNGQETSTAGRQTAVVYLTKETLQTLTAEPFPVEKTSSSLLEGWLESVLHPLLHRPSSHPAGGETFYYVLFSLDAVLYTVDHGDNPLLKEIQSSLHSPDHPGMNSRVKSFFLCPLPSVNPSSGTRKEWNDLYFLYRKVKSDKKINLSAHYPKWFLWHEAESVSPCANPNNNNNIEWITMKRAKRLQAKKSILSLLQHHHPPHTKLSSEHYKYAMKQDTNNNNNTNSNRSNQKERSTAH
ncbi:hypothetical protein ADEAN_000182000 [Angomonas deanei]|uniref:Uncharacterized protein n=1 Tax=Angomonas deanei TaxID=59799 RepID=A0A7G2C4D5_9TRYP|nr:hypothetical protein ADEAN_000182000 [Angomonas deanei]